MSINKTKKKKKKKKDEKTSRDKYDISSSEDDEIFNDIDDVFMFFIVHKGRKMYFEFPLLVDRSYMLSSIKSRVALNRGFSLGWISPATHPTSTRTMGKSTTKSPTSYDVCIHSTNISAERLSEFHGETLYVLPSNSQLGSEATALNTVSRYPLKRSKKRLQHEIYTTSDCPP